MQLPHRVGAAQQGHLLPLGQGGSREGPLDQSGVQGGPQPPVHGPVKGVQAGIQHRPAKTLLLRDVQGIVVPAPLQRLRLVRKFPGHAKLLGDGEQPDAPGGAAQRRAAGEHGQRHGEDEREDHRQQPEEEGWGRPVEQPAPEQPDGGRPPVRPDCLAPRGAAVVPRLSPPARSPAQQGHEDEPAVADHADRRQQHGEDRLARHAEQHPPHPAVAPRVPGRQQGVEQAEDLRQEEQQGRAAQEAQRPLRVPDVPFGEQHVVLRKVHGLHQDVQQRLHGAGRQEDQPQQRGAVGEDAVEEEGSVRGEETVGEDQAQVLEVPLAPAPVAFHLVDQRGRRLLVTAADPIGQPHLVACAADQGGLDEVVAQDIPAEGPPAREPWQLAPAHEGLDADDGVVPPVLSVAQLPEVLAGREDRPVQAVGELLHSRDQGLAVHPLGGRLENPDPGVPLHGVDHAHPGLPGHDAVRVQDDHIAVVAAPAAAEVCDVAALPLRVGGPAAVEEVSLHPRQAPELVPHRLLAHPDVGVRGVAEDEKVETPLQSRGGQGAPHRGDPRADALRVLVVDGDEHRRPDPLRKVRERRAGVDDPVSGVPEEQHEEPEERRPEPRRDPGEEHPEQDAESQLHQGPAPVGKQGGHVGGGQDGGDEDQEEKEPTPPESGEPPGGTGVWGMRHRVRSSLGRRSLPTRPLRENPPRVMEIFAGGIDPRL